MSDKSEHRVWGIHTLDDTLFLQSGIIAIGWHEFGDLRKVGKTRDDFKKMYIKLHEKDYDFKRGRAPTAAGMLYRFLYEIKVGDYVVFPSKKDRMINIGQVTSDYQYVQSAGEYVNQREVKWINSSPRISFTNGALCEIGSALTLFSVKSYATEFLSTIKVKKKATIIKEEDESSGMSAEETLSTTKDFIVKELSRQLKGYDLEDFVAALLNAMGYRTELSPHGGDHTRDIIAYKDELPPRIVVQVKSQDEDIKEDLVQKLKGAMVEGDYGLYVTLSNYKPNAQAFLKANPKIRGIDGYGLAELVLKYYPQLDDWCKKIIPLKMVYVPDLSKEEEKEQGTLDHYING